MINATIAGGADTTTDDAEFLVIADNEFKIASLLPELDVLILDNEFNSWVCVSFIILESGVLDCVLTGVFVT